MTNVEVPAPPMPPWEPVADVDDTVRREQEERIARFEALLAATDDEDARREIQEVLDALYVAAGIEHSIEPASDQALEEWREQRYR